MQTKRRIFSFPFVSVSILTLQSLVLLQIPLLNVLGLEFAVASVPLVSLLAAISVIRLHRLGLLSPDPFRKLLQGLRGTWHLIVLPGFLASLNAVFVTNCSPLEGLAYYLLIVPFGALFMIAVTILTHVIVPGFPRTATILTWAGVLFHILVVSFFGPQIFAYNPIVGYFPGISYDSTRSVLSALVLYRCVTLLLIVALLETAKRMGAMGSGFTSNVWKNGRVLIGAWSALTVIWFASDHLGFSSSLSRIEQELGGVLRTEHFVIIYPRHRLDTEEAARFAEYHEFLYHSIAQTLRVSTSRQIISIYYDSPEQKAALVGGGNTNFTKPWLWQMHMSFSDRERVLKHELVHILAAEFGFPFIRVGLNSGFIEGLAVALERESYGMPLDRAAAAIGQVAGKSDIAGVFSMTGFFRSHSSVSYTLAGSFSRHLIERYGVRRFKRAYRSGSFSVYGRSFDSLVEEWRRGIMQISLSGGELLKARYLFDRPPSFTEECFQYKGNTLREAREALRAGQDSTAAAIAERVFERSPSPEAAYVRAQALVRNGRMRDALDVIGERMGSGIDTVFLPFSLVAGDALWGLDSGRAAGDRYAMLVQADLSDGWTETARFRMSMLTRFMDDTAVRDAVIGSMADSARRVVFRTLATSTDDPLAWYALSRFLESGANADEAMDVLSRAGTVEDSFLRYVVKRRLTGLHRSKKEYERAKAILWEAQNDVQDEIRLREISEGIEWSDWLKIRLP